MSAYEIIPLRDHPHNLCPAGKLEWFEMPKAVYSVRAGYVAVVSHNECINHTFPSKADALLAAREVAK